MVDRLSRFWKYALTLLAAAVVLIFTAAFSFTDDRLHLVFCDVGQGDAILIYQKATQVLIDGGPDRSVLSCLSRNMPFWDRKVELLVITNADADHYVGFIDVVRRYQIGAIATSTVGKDDVSFQALEAEIKRKKIKVITLAQGDKVQVGAISLLTLWPTQEYLASHLKESIEDKGTRVLGATSIKKSVNEFSLVQALSYGEFDALLTGDLVPPATDQVSDKLSLTAYRVSDSDRQWEVLKVPHHGSKNGLTQKLLEEVNPKLAVISVGKNNRYGHPHEETLALLRNYVTTLLRTDLDGEIEIVTDGKGWSYKTHGQ